MGCGASTYAADLRRARLEADELRNKVVQLEADVEDYLQKNELRNKVDQLEADVEDYSQKVSNPEESLLQNASVNERSHCQENIPCNTGPVHDLAPDLAPEDHPPRSELPEENAPNIYTAECCGVTGPSTDTVIEDGTGDTGPDISPVAYNLPGTVNQDIIGLDDDDASLCRVASEPELQHIQNPEESALECGEQATADPQRTLGLTGAKCLDECPELTPFPERAECPEQTPILEDADGTGQLPQTDCSSNLEKTQKEDSKLACSIGSTASTCTPKAAHGETIRFCHQCSAKASQLYLDSSDMNQYCENCWADYYGQTPIRGDGVHLVYVEVADVMSESRLAQFWATEILPGWPPPVIHSTPGTHTDTEVWSTVNVRVRRDLVGPHAREQNNTGRLHEGEILSKRYRIMYPVGEGHFTKAFKADDINTGKSVCVKRHRNLSIDSLADLLVIGKRMEVVDEEGVLFPLLLDVFYDIVGFTVESLIEGQDCMSLVQSDSLFFHSMPNLQIVAEGTLKGLAALANAGIVHNDMKPDNFIWDPAGNSCVKIVDFGCARLDMREEPIGRNWSLAEGGAGHLGKWSPEMALRLPITCQGDVWGVAISLCELYCCRFMWRSETDTAEVILAQSLGLCGLTGGVPSSLLRRSPLDVRQLYTPAPCHFPVRLNTLGQLEMLRPATWGLEQVIGDGWREGQTAALGMFLEKMLEFDPDLRPSAHQLLGDGISFYSD